MIDPRAATLVLYHRQGCHLCDRMLARLRQLEAAWGFQVRLADVDEDPDWIARHGHRVPVLAMDGQEVCHYFLDEDALRRCLALPASPP